MLEGLDVKIEYFKNFITICETGSFSAAAKTLKKSQGAISQQISLLEKEFGVEEVNTVTYFADRDVCARYTCHHIKSGQGGRPEQSYTCQRNK